MADVPDWVGGTSGNQGPLTPQMPGGLGALGSAGSIDRIATVLASNGQTLGKLLSTLVSIFPFSGTVGTFTLAAAASTTVTEANVKTNSVIIPFPTNAAAGTLQGSAKSLYVSARTAGTSFAVSTASAASAAGTETFFYLLVNPTG